MEKPHDIVILGNNLAGVAAAHYLLKNTLKALREIRSNRHHRIVIVGPTKTCFYKPCLPRVLAAPHLLNLGQASVSFEEVFTQYSKEEFLWIQGLATDLREADKQVIIQLLDGSKKEVQYDSLVIATGLSLDPLWAVYDDFSQTRAGIEAVQNALPKANTVLIAGGGPVGVEMAGEITAAYPHAKVKLLSGTDRILKNMRPRYSAIAERKLKRRGVEVVHHKKVTAPSFSSTSNPTVAFDDGSSETVDIYIRAVGGSPNTGFLPSHWLDDRQRVKVDYDTLRSPIADVYALGDAASYSRGMVMDIKYSWSALVSSLGQDLAAKLDTQVKHQSGALRTRKFRPLPDTQFVPVGRFGGVATLFGFPCPDILIWLVKARTYFVGQAKPAMDGRDYERA